MSDEQCCAVGDGGYRKPSLNRRLWFAVRERFMSFFRRRLYRHIMRFAHRYNWHYAPPRNRWPDDKPWDRHHWCQWCGLRGTTIDAKGPLWTVEEAMLDKAVEKVGKPEPCSPKTG